MTTLKRLSLYNIPNELRKEIKSNPDYDGYNTIIQQEIQSFKTNIKDKKNIINKLLSNNQFLFKIIKLMIYTITITKKLTDLSLNFDVYERKVFTPYSSWSLFLDYYMPDLVELYRTDNDEEKWPKNMWALYFTNQLVWKIYWTRLNVIDINIFSDIYFLQRNDKIDLLKNIINKFYSEDISENNLLILSFKIFKFLMKNVSKNDMVDEGY